MIKVKEERRGEIGKKGRPGAGIKGAFSLLPPCSIFFYFLFSRPTVASFLRSFSDCSLEMRLKVGEREGERERAGEKSEAL